MPELPEVERARKLIADTCTGYLIKSVDSTEDKLVYTGGTNHEEFAKEITGRTITGCERKGKTFWMTLSGEGRFPVMHFGMTGMVQLKGQDPTWYRRRPREKSKTWPPKFYKFVLDLEPQPGSVSDEPRSLAFLDGRRFGRLRLVPQPVADHVPVKALGFDPVQDHPTLERFKELLKKKKGTTKGVIMDQAFSAGVGNWVADEILYQARIHPACPVPSLTESDIERLHHWIRQVPLTAVDVNADHRQFPEDWLFRWRWSKGQKHNKGSNKAKAQEEVKSEESDGDGDEELEDIKPKNKDFLALPNGKPATIIFIEVGGRTTAVVDELQKMPEGVEIKPKIKKGPRTPKKDKGDSDGEPGDDLPSSNTADVKDEEEEVIISRKTTARQRSGKRKSVAETEDLKPDIDEVDEASRTGAKKSRRSNGTSNGKHARVSSASRSKKGKESRAESSELSDAPE